MTAQELDLNKTMILYSETSETKIEGNPFDENDLIWHRTTDTTIISKTSLELKSSKRF